MNLDHQKIQTLLDEYIDGGLTAAERAGVEVHLESCAGCTAEIESLLALRAGTGELPREIAPGRDLWPEILARIQSTGGTTTSAPERVAEVGGGAGVVDLASRRRRPSRWTRGMGRAAAVFALVVASSGVTAYLMRGSPAIDPVAVAPATTGSEVSPPNTAPSSLTPALTSDQPNAASASPGRAAPAPSNVRLASSTTDPHDIEAFRTGAGGFDGAVEELSATFEKQRDRLSPETVKVIEQNLAIIDRAIAESRAALEKDPNDPELPLLLSGVYRQKVELLESAVQLQART
jgi:anti-sigma factor RsiW